jgi:uncharacterized membrane protein YozB (DUF420 family)
MSPLISPEINLVFQIVILAIIFVAFALKKMRKYLLHGWMMLVGVVLNALSFVLIMVPSFSNMREFILANALNRISLVTLAHGVLGGIAEVLGVILIAYWHLQSSTKNCVRRKKVMRITFGLWVIALLLGILLYILSYTSILG